MKCPPKFAVFVDRDGVITDLPNYKESNEVEFISKKEHIKFIDGSIEAIKLLNSNKIPIIIISNQPQIARGLATKKQIDDINKEIIKMLRKDDASIDSIYYCPHHPTKGINKYKIDCNCRKPKPGLILKAAEDHNISLKESYMIGDRISDIKAGFLASCKTIGVETGYACNDGFKDATPKAKAKNFLEAVKLILRENKK